MATEHREEVLKWNGCSQRQHRIRVKQIPGSAHWNILKESRGVHAGEWELDWATEANTKPDWGESDGAD